MTPRWLPVAALGLFVPSVPSLAAASTARLSWSTTDSLAQDLTTPGSLNNLYVWFNDVPYFAGGEVDIVWDPPGDGSTLCFTHLGTLYRTATTCTYLNRGTAVPVITADDPGHFHVAWANNQATTCTAGVGLVVQFGFSDCPTTRGCFHLTYAQAGLCPPAGAPSRDGNVPLCHSDDPPCVITGPIATVLGGAGETCGVTDRVPAAWGAIKALYRD